MTEKYKNTTFQKSPISNSTLSSFTARLSEYDGGKNLARSMIRCYTAMFKGEESIEKRDIKILRAQLLPRLLLKEPKNKPDAKRVDLERHGFGG